MHEQNFEKQVQQKMDELSLTPSAPVWQKVEAQIRKKKDRRRLIFWLLPLLLVSGGAWWLLSGHPGLHTPATGQTQPQSAAPKSHQQSLPTTSAPTYTIEEKSSMAPDIKTLPETVPSPLGITPSLSAHPSQYATRRAVPQQRTIVLQKEADKEKEAIVVTEEEAINQKAVAVTKEINALSQPVSDTTVTGEEKDLTQNKVEPPVVTTPASAAPQPTIDSVTLKAPSPVKEAGTHKWQWAAHAEAGITSVQSALFQLSSTRAQDYMASPGTGSSGSGNFFSYTPPRLQNGAAVSAGVTLKRQVSHRTHLTAGVQYHFYSTHQAVGQAVETDTTLMYSGSARTITKHFRPGSSSTADAQNDYRNQYHFVELPLGVEYQLLRRLPLHLQAGATLAQMIGTNALLYDYRAHIFYQDSRAFHKTQLHLFSNLTYTLWKGKTRTLNVGPYAQYGLTQLQKTGTEKNRLFSAGVRTQLSF